MIYHLLSLMKYQYRQSNPMDLLCQQRSQISLLTLKNRRQVYRSPTRESSNPRQPKMTRKIGQTMFHLFLLGPY